MQIEPSPATTPVTTTDLNTEIFMELLNLTQVKPGMRLGKAVFSSEGALLLPPGEMLDENSLQMLGQHGVKDVMVGVRSPEPISLQHVSQPEDLLRHVRQIVTKRFGQTDIDHPHMRALFELAVERQGRLLLSCPGKVSPGKEALPSFQMPMPPKAALASLIDKSHRIGTLPIVFQRLVSLLNNNDTTIDEIAEIITTDPTLTAKLLRLVNSPFYGLAYTIDTIPRAVVMVGTRQLVMLAMGTTLITAFKGLPVSLVNMQSFWTHSLSTGAAARLLARALNMPQAESYFVAGLLHDIARLLLFTQLPKHALYILSEAKRRRQSVHSLEQECLGFTHEELGKELLSSWRCPKDLITRVADHHKPLLDDFEKNEIIIPLSDMLSRALGYGSSGEIVLPSFDDAVWEKLGLSPKELVEICRKLDDSVRHLRSLFTAAV